MKKSAGRSRDEIRRKLFPREYLKDFNGAKAAVRSGYSKKAARQIASRLLTRANIQAEIRRLMKAREERTEITVDRIEYELAIIGFSDIRDYLTIDRDSGAVRSKGFEDMPKDASRAIESVEEKRSISENAEDGKDRVILYDDFKFKRYDKIRALELLGKRRGMFPTKIEGGLTLQAKLSLEDFKKSAKGLKDADAGD